MKDAVILPCKHIFHEECIRQWILKNLNHFCPKCKHELNFDKLGEMYDEKKKKEKPFNEMLNTINQKKERRFTEK
jgi:hypothetical protein